MIRNFGQSEDFKFKSLSKLQMRFLSMNIIYERCYVKVRGFKIYFCFFNMLVCIVVEVVLKIFLFVFDVIVFFEFFCILK